MGNYKRVSCIKCNMYSYSLRRCLQDKINPKTRKDYNSAVNVMGASYICNQNEFKRELLFKERI